jgi:glycerate-2-kinase
MGRELASAYSGYAYFAAVASDGQDHLPGVGGAWADSFSWNRIAANSVDVELALSNNDSYNVLSKVGGLLPGTRTGWNLCDIYVLCAEA